MLETKDICYQVEQKEILRNVSARFQPGKFNMILGPNGSGKSSFLKIFSGAMPATTGEVIYQDQMLRQWSVQDLSRCRAVMSQEPDLHFPLLVEEVVMMGRYPHFHFSPREIDGTICSQVMKRLNLQAMAGRNYLTLSGGEKQRVQFARVLAQVWEKPASGCRYLFLDEPLNSLDIAYQQEFLRLAKSILDPETVLIAVMHDINLAAQYGDELFFFKSGELVTAGPPGTVLQESLIKKIFGVEVLIKRHPVTGVPVMLYES